MLRKVVCSIGLALCWYLLYLTEYVGICLGHCDPFNYCLGSAWFLLGIVVERDKIVKFWAILGLIGIAYFVVREFFEGFCFYCTILHVLGLTAILSLKIDLKLLSRRRMAR